MKNPDSESWDIYLNNKNLGIIKHGVIKVPAGTAKENVLLGVKRDIDKTAFIAKQPQKRKTARIRNSDENEL